MVRRDRKCTDRRIDDRDQTTAALCVHLVRTQDGVTAQDGIAPRAIIEGRGLVWEPEQASIVDDVSLVLPTEQRCSAHPATTNAPSRRQRRTSGSRYRASRAVRAPAAWVLWDNRDQGFSCDWRGANHALITHASRPPRHAQPSMTGHDCHPASLVTGRHCHEDDGISAACPIRPGWHRHSCQCDR